VSAVRPDHGGRDGSDSSEPAVLCESLTHVYRDDAGTEVTALAEVSLRVQPGETVALVGPSGAGKSTLLMLLSGLVRPTAGRIQVTGSEVNELTERALLRFRARSVGMVLQTPGRNLLPYATARQNVRLAQRHGHRPRAARRDEADELLESVDLSEHAGRSARLLSGGQQQRLALAVALAGRPAVLLADEPTSQLDRHTGDTVIALMLAARESRGTALVVVTHDLRVSEALDSGYVLRDGHLEAGG
jgi:putative ABC transport system ATP-binding protein